MTNTPHKAPWLLARSAQAAIAVAAVADLFRATSFRDSHLEPMAASTDTAGRNSLLLGNLMFLAVILFLLWLVRSRRIAEQMSPDAPLPGAGWTVGAWFVPVANFIVPRGFLLQVGRASSPSWTKRDNALVNAWWAAWVGHALLLGFFAQTSPDSLAVLVVGQVLMFAAAVLAGLMIQRITTLQSSAACDTAAAPGTPVAQA
ncbi:DUF4328 domain-containing protein [Streptomyces sp. CO7]